MSASERIAIIAGGGALPLALKEARPEALVYAPVGVETALEAEPFHFERLVPFLDGLVAAGVTTVVLAGAMQRPRLDPSLFDAQTAQLVPRLLAAMQGGDDATLREVMSLIEEAGLQIASAHGIAPDLVPGAGVLTTHHPSEGDQRDAARGAAIVAALGAVDVGQGAVVAGGLCLAVEALPGTDAMLGFVAAAAPSLRAAGLQTSRGVFYKAPKPGQDRRVDLPALGPETVRRAAAAGLAGIAWEAGGVILLDPAAMRAEAEAAGLFLWARPA